MTVLCWWMGFPSPPYVSKLLDQSKADARPSSIQQGPPIRRALQRYKDTKVQLRIIRSFFRSVVPFCRTDDAQHTTTF
jgi:hypothetical protein